MSGWKSTRDRVNNLSVKFETEWGTWRRWSAEHPISGQLVAAAVVGLGTWLTMKIRGY